MFHREEYSSDHPEKDIKPFEKTFPFTHLFALGSSGFSFFTLVVVVAVGFGVGTLFTFKSCYEKETNLT